MNDTYLDFYKTIGSRIREIRIKKGMSQAELAEKADLSLPVISSIENAHTKIWLITFAKIAEALEVSADDILRLNTPAPSMGYSDEFAELLNGCNQTEAEAIMAIARQMKSSLEAQKKMFTE